MDRGDQYIQLVKVLYCKLPTNGKQLPAFSLEVGPGTELRSQRWEARVLPLYHQAPKYHITVGFIFTLQMTPLVKLIHVIFVFCDSICHGDYRRLSRFIRKSTSVDNSISKEFYCMNFTVKELNKFVSNMLCN